MPAPRSKQSCIFAPFTGICVIGTRLGPADLLVLRFVKLYLCGSAGRLKHWIVCRTNILLFVLTEGVSISSCLRRVDIVRVFPMHCPSQSNQHALHFEQSAVACLRVSSPHLRRHVNGL